MAQAQYHLGQNNNNNQHHIELQVQLDQPSSSSSRLEFLGSPSPPTTSSSSPVTNKTLIHAGHYRAILSSDVNELHSFDVSEQLRDSINNTVLHIAVSAGQIEHMEYIVAQCPNLLRCQNAEGDLPAHVAARAGHSETVKRLVSVADQYQVNGKDLMLAKENNEKNTALHIALENQQKELAEYLFEQCPHTFCILNSQGVSPLYLAIKVGFCDLVKQMLEHEHLGSWSPENGRKSVVHAAIAAHNIEILKKILEVKGDEQMYSVDENNRRPLSYAAYIGYLDGVKYMLNNFQNQAFKQNDDEDGSFPIHMACKGGNIQVVKELLKLPGKMMWLLNKKGQNILHVAAYSGKDEVVKYILNRHELVTMINMKDEDGCTPLHLAALGRHPKVVYALTWDTRVKLDLQSKGGSTALDIAEDFGDVLSFEQRLTWLALRYAGVQKAPQLQGLQVFHSSSIRAPHQLDDSAMNGLNESVLHGHFNPKNFMVEHGNLLTNLPKKRKSKYKERLNTLLIISTLVATVTYAAAFTVPGGYNNSDPHVGMATLAHKCAFQVFVISNTIAMYSAILAMVTLIWAHLDDLRLILLSLDLALPLLGLALAMMSVAFMSGLYVVLHDLLVLRIVVLVMGVGFLSLLFVFFIPLYSPRYCMNCRILRYLLHVPFKLMLLACKSRRETFY